MFGPFSKPKKRTAFTLLLLLAFAGLYSLFSSRENVKPSASVSPEVTPPPMAAVAPGPQSISPASMPSASPLVEESSPPPAHSAPQPPQNRPQKTRAPASATTPLEDFTEPTSSAEPLPEAPPPVERQIKNSVWVGSGANLVSLNQGSNAQNYSLSGVDGPSLSLGGYVNINEDWGAKISARLIPAQVEGQKLSGQSQDFSWKIVEAEAARRLDSDSLKERDGELQLLAGFQHHELPLLLTQSSGQAELATAKIEALSLGINAEFYKTKKWSYLTYLRYQYPFLSNASSGSLTLKPTFSFDGSVGTLYSVSEIWKLGLFWYGQYHSYNFAYVSPSHREEGSKQVFFSNLELRLLYGF